VQAILTKATQRLYFLKQLKRAGVPCAQLLHFYLTVIRPVLEYATPVWHHLITEAHTEQIEAVQKKEPFESSIVIPVICHTSMHYT